MATATVITGRLGEFAINTTKVARTKKWTINPKLATSSEWGDSDTEGYTARAAGRRDATFDAEGAFDTDSEQYDVFVPGDCAEAILWLNSTLFYYFPSVLCLDFSLTVDMDTEEVVGWTSNWGANGIYYKPGAASPTSAYPG